MLDDDALRAMAHGAVAAQRGFLEVIALTALDAEQALVTCHAWLGPG